MWNKTHIQLWKYVVCLFLFGVSYTQLIAAPARVLTTDEVAVFGDRSRAKPYREILVGLFADGNSIGELELLQAENQQLIPLQSLLESIQSQINSEADHIEVSTPGGNIDIPSSETVLFRDTIYISETTLNEQLHLNASFDQSSFALTILLPWNNPKAKQIATQKKLVADYHPDTFSLQTLRFDHSQYWVNSDHRYVNSFRLGGNLQPGGWLVDIEQDDDDITATDYYWLGVHNSTQWLVGKQSVSLHPLLVSSQLTGFQAVFGNSENDSLNNANSRNHFGSRLGRATRDIRGTAKPGYAAVLRINQKLVAVTRVRLDGTYEFLEVHLPSRNYNDVVVEIYNRANGSLIESENFSQTIDDILLNQGEHISSIGMGESGDALNSDNIDGFAGYLQTRYGISERVTLEAGYLSDDGEDSSYIGSSASIGRHFIASMALADSSHANRAQLDLDGHARNWQLNSLITYTDSKAVGSQDTVIGNVYYRHAVSKALLLGLRGEYFDRGDEDDENYLLPGFTWLPLPALFMSAWPVTADSYRANIRYRLNQSTRINYDYESDAYTFEINQDLPGNAEWFYAYQETPEFDNLHQLGFEFRTNEDTDSRIRATALFTDEGESGFELDWKAQLYPGIYTSLSAVDRPERQAELYESEDLLVSLNVSITLGFPGNKVSLGHTESFDQYGGTIAGFVNIPRDKECDIDSITLLLNNEHRAVRLRKCSFAIKNLPRGIYQVRLAPESLPLEYVPDDRSINVEVGTGATTEILFDLTVQYGVSGKITRAGAAVVNEKIFVLSSEGVTIASTTTDRFGYYRIDKLIPGEYALSMTNNTRSSHRKFIVSDKHLFDINLQSGILE